MKKRIHVLCLLLAGLLADANAETQTYTLHDLSWSDSGGAVSTVTNGVLKITASKNSQVTAPLPKSITLSETGNSLAVSFGITVSGEPFVDNGSVFRIGFNNSSVHYAYYAATEPVGGASQAIFGETDDTNLGRFDVLGLGSTSRTVRFTLTKTALTAGLDLTAAGSLVDEPGNSITVEPDIVPATTTTFNELYFYCAGTLWTNGQTVTISNLTVETVLPDPPPATNSISYNSWTASNSLSGSAALADSDPDGDGIDNLIEFATGSDPRQFNAPPLTGYAASNGMFLITYPRQTGGTGGTPYTANKITYTLECCDSLVSNVWKNADAEITGTPVADTNGVTERATLQFPATNAIGFVRLKIQYAGSLPSFSEPVPLELLENGDFESGDTGWSADGQHIIVSDVVHSGSFALKYQGPDTYAGAQVFYIIGGRQYRFSGWLKTGTNYTGTAGISLNFRDKDAVNLGSVTAGGTRFGAGTDWTNLVEIVTAPTNAAKMKVLLTTGGSGDVWYDDLSVLPYEFPEDPAIDAPANPPIPGTWVTTFEDNFDGSGLDGNKWQVSGLNGLAVSSPDRCQVTNGVLTISAAKIPAMLKGVSNDWSSAQISTYRNFRQLYGYFEARMRYETKVGLWPAFWTMPDRGWYGDTNENYQTWLQFDLSGYTGTVADARLELTVSAATSKETVLNVFAAPDNWTETGITWNSRPVVNPLWLKHDWIPAVQPGDVRIYDISDYVNQQIAGDRTVSLCLADTFQQGLLFSLYSREAADLSVRPRLILDGTAIAPVADATVRSGSYANANYASDTTLKVKDAWQANNRSTYDGGMEMDVFEWLGVWAPYELHSALHWDGYFSDHQKTNWPYTVVGNTIAEYHTYGVYWAPGLIEFYFDGQSTGGIFESNRVCTIPSYPILSLQMGGWSGNDNPDNIDEDEYPGRMDVDYVKVWSGTRN